MSFFADEVQHRLAVVVDVADVGARVQEEEQRVRTAAAPPSHIHPAVSAQASDGGACAHTDRKGEPRVVTSATIRFGRSRLQSAFPENVQKSDIPRDSVD